MMDFKFFYELISLKEKRVKFRVKLFSPIIIEGKLGYIDVEHDEQDRPKRIRAIRIGKNFIPVEHIKWMSPDIKVKKLKRGRAFSIRGRLPRKIFGELRSKAIPCYFYLFGREKLSGVLGDLSYYTLYVFAPDPEDKEKAKLYYLFKHATKMIVRADKFAIPFFKTSLISHPEPPIVKRVKLREWLFPRHLKGYKLYKLLKENVSVRIREGMQVFGKLIGLSNYEIVLYSNGVKALIFRHALEEVERFVIPSPIGLTEEWMRQQEIVIRRDGRHFIITRGSERYKVPVSQYRNLNQIVEKIINKTMSEKQV